MPKQVSLEQTVSMEARGGKDLRDAWIDSEVPQSGSIRKSRYRGIVP